ncbi:MAG: hypothetical protein Ta2B_28910 [Termitinemataceae bacterium]|nr:MAG: hypothetical protein Ta2B_28910 [Termitinemataceae bacterium]
MQNKFKNILHSLSIYLLLILPTIFFITQKKEKLNVIFDFSVQSELITIFSYRIPLFILICFLLKVQTKSIYPILPLRKPSRISLIALGSAFIFLFVFAQLVMFIFTDIFFIAQPQYQKIPNSVVSHIIIVISSLSTAYLEESYFRFYLVKNICEAIKIPAGRHLKITFAITISSAMFAFCHIWEGAPGITNAFFAGIILNMVFIRSKSFHAIALAHCVFDVLAFEMMVFG